MVMARQGQIWLKKRIKSRANPCETPMDHLQWYYYEEQSFKRDGFCVGFPSNFFVGLSKRYSKMGMGNPHWG
jgi:hypothetical protein